MRILLPILGLVLWFFAIKGCVLEPRCDECCSAEKTSTTVPPTKLKDQTGPLLYKWGSCDPVSQNQFTSIRDSILLGMNDDRALEIIGFYCAGETSVCEEKDLGLARAQKIGGLFDGKIEAGKLRLRSRLSNENCDELRSILFRGVQMRYLVDNEFVKEIDDRTLIYFEYGTDRKVANPKIDAYLRDVASRVKKSGEKIVLTGHTDNTGNPDKNLSLGQKRADAIRDILVAQGVAAANITTSTKGEAKPIDTNETTVGRQRNRRTELQIVK